MTPQRVQQIVKEATGVSRADAAARFSGMPTIRQLEEALAKQPARDAARPPDPLRLSSEALRWGLENDLAPVETKNALWALLDEARLTRWIALASLLVSLATLLVVLLRG